MSRLQELREVVDALTPVPEDELDWFLVLSDGSSCTIRDAIAACGTTTPDEEA